MAARELAGAPRTSRMAANKRFFSFRASRRASACSSSSLAFFISSTEARNPLSLPGGRQSHRHASGHLAFVAYNWSGQSRPTM